MDDDYDPPELGKLFYSGINPNADRAEYALPPGTPALMDGEDEYPEEYTSPNPESNETVTPRSLVALAFDRFGRTATLATTAGTLIALSFVFGMSIRGCADTASDPTQSMSQAHERLYHWAIKLANGPDDQLVKFREPFLDAVGVIGTSKSTKLWDGVLKLASLSKIEDNVEYWDTKQSDIGTSSCKMPSLSLSGKYDSSDGPSSYSFPGLPGRLRQQIIISESRIRNLQYGVKLKGFWVRRDIHYNLLSAEYDQDS